MAKIWLSLILAASVTLSGCTSAIHAVTKEPIRPDPSKTSMGTDLDDWQMDTLIGVNIKKAAPQLERSHVNVHTYNKVVLLTGEVPSSDMRSLAGDTARNFRGVRQVYNELQIQGATSMLARTNDSWLSTKVKSKLLANRDIKSGRVKVITENGVVYLMGLVSRREADNITAIASHTRGARKIVRVFEYIDN
ncbi:MAG: BON domain-containing protein [Porticoccaceae bacterium]|nr:BON domain-containing protein [Porticoccaceae bacterium]